MTDPSNADGPDWVEFTSKSDMRYKKALEARETKSLASHNLLSGGQEEIGICLSLAKLFLNAEPKTGNALDLCCGAGYITDCLHGIGFSSHGIDLNEDAIAIATQSYPHCTFAVADVSKIAGTLSEQRFDVILAREAHPFSRIGDINFHKEVIKQYLELLRPGGLFIISHARRGGGMDFPSLDYKQLKTINSLGVTMAGPFFPHLIKRFKPALGNRLACEFLSKGTDVYQRLTNNRLIEIFLMHKPK